MVKVVTAPMAKLVNDMFVQSIHLRCGTCDQLLRVLNVDHDPKNSLRCTKSPSGDQEATNHSKACTKSVEPVIFMSSSNNESSAERANHADERVWNKMSAGIGSGHLSYSCKVERDTI